MSTSVVFPSFTRASVVRVPNPCRRERRATVLALRRQPLGVATMTVTNPSSGTNVAEVADGVYRINTPVQIQGGPGPFSFNQYLVVDEQPLLFHTGPRR